MAYGIGSGLCSNDTFLVVPHKIKQVERLHLPKSSISLYSLSFHLNSNDRMFKNCKSDCLHSKKKFPQTYDLYMIK